MPGDHLALEPYNVVSHATSPEGVISFELTVNGEVYGREDAPADQKGTSLAYVSQTWEPAAPGTYLLSVRAADASGALGPKVDVQVEVGQVSPPSAQATETPATPEMVLSCTFSAAINLFCRAGPGQEHKDADSFTPGQMATVVGESTDGFYWYVQGPNLGVLCTVPKGDRFGSVAGDCTQLSVFTPVPLPPTATPTPCPPSAIPLAGC